MTDPVTGTAKLFGWIRPHVHTSPYSLNDTLAPVDTDWPHRLAAVDTD